MKFIKFSVLVALLVGSVALYQNSQAQQMQENLSSSVARIKDLLSQEIKENPVFEGNRESIQYVLDNSGNGALIAPDCPMYAALLVHSVNQNALFDSYYNIQGNFGYKFAFVENGKPKLVNYNFYEVYDSGADRLLGHQTSITVTAFRAHNELDNTQSVKYIVDNICTPLNRFLAQNAGAAPAEILAKMRLYFTK